MIDNIEKYSDKELTRILTYTGYVFLSFELVKNMIVDPVKAFYENIVFQGLPFTTYKEDVLVRHKNEFEACLLYLRDFMKAIDKKDFLIIQALRKHRNDLAHNLPNRLSLDELEKNADLMENAKYVIYKISSYRVRMEVGFDPILAGVDWTKVKGPEYLILETIIEKVKSLKLK